MAIVKIIHTFVVVVVVVELRLISRWLLNEIPIRERVEGHVMTASFASRYYKNRTYLFLSLSFD